MRPVARDTLRERVYEEIRAALMEGKFKPGEPLRLQALADAVGTSLMPVREALRRLAAERALVNADSRTMFVPFPSVEDFGEILETRLQLEPFAAGLASRQLDNKQLAELEDLHEKMASAPRPADYLRCNRQFHFCLYRAANRPILVSLIESLWLHIGPLLNHLLGQESLPETRGRVDLTGVHHLRVIEALRARDPAATAGAIAEDIISAGETIKLLLGKEQRA